MKRYVKWTLNAAAVAGLAAASITGCQSYSLEELRHTTPTGNAFQTALAKFYMDFAADEEKEYDWFNSWHFADKGLTAAYGHDVAPEDLKNWNIPADKLPDLDKAHDALMAALTPANMQAHPDSLAQAQYGFDCWVEQQEENWQEDDIAHCRDLYDTAMRDLNVTVIGALTPDSEEKAIAQYEADQKSGSTSEDLPVLHAKKHASHAAVTEKTAEKSAGSAPTEAYAVFFEAGKPTLTAAGQSVVEDILQSLEKKKNYQIALHEKASDDVQLAGLRAQTVKLRLIEGGVSESAITVDASKKLAAKPGAARIDVFLNE